MGDLRPALPEPNEPELTAGDRVLSADPELWAKVQAHRRKLFEQEQQREQAREVLEALEEAAGVTGETWDSLSQGLRIAETTDYLEVPVRSAMVEALGTPGQATMVERRQARTTRDQQRDADWDARATGTMQRAVDGAA